MTLVKYWARKHGLFKDDPAPHELHGSPTTVVYLAADVDAVLNKCEDAMAACIIAIDIAHRLLAQRKETP